LFTNWPKNKLDINRASLFVFRLKQRRKQWRKEQTVVLVAWRAVIIARGACYS